MWSIMYIDKIVIGGTRLARSLHAVYVAANPLYLTIQMMDLFFVDLEIGSSNTQCHVTC